MRVGDEQIGVPSILFRGTKAAIEALEPTAGQLAYATDDQLIGYSNGAGWVWINLANTALQLHAIEHQNGGGDEIDVAGLSGVLADPQNAGSLLGYVIDLTGLANGYTLVYNQGADKFVPAEGGSGTTGPHNTSHQDGGNDEIDVTGLSGLLADPQTPAAHNHDAAYSLLGHTHAPAAPAAHAVTHEHGGDDELDVTGLSGLLVDEQDAGAIKGTPVDVAGLLSDHLLIFNGTNWTTVHQSLVGGAGGVHAANHQNGGLDEINVTGLSGLLADPQTPAAHSHPEYPLKAGAEAITGAWTFNRPSAAPFIVPSTATKVTYLDADKLDGYHYNGIASALSKDLTYYVATTGSDSNTGLSAGAPLRNIQTAIDKFAGYSVRNCKIIVSEGDYSEALKLYGLHSSMVDGLTIEGDTRNVAGLSFIHGDNPDNLVTNTYAGSGAVTLSATNGGGNNRIRIVVSRATTQPNFALLGLEMGDKVIVFGGGNYVEYDIYDASGNAIVLTDTSAAPAMNVAGRFITICPKVRIFGPTQNDVYAMEVQNSGVRLKGLYLTGYFGALRAYMGGIMSERCVYHSRVSVNYFGTVHLASLSFFFARYDSLYDAFNTITGYWAAIVISLSSHANIAKNIIAGTGGYGIFCSGGTGYAVAARISGGSSIGVYAAGRGYVNASTTNATNWAPTKYSPATTDTLGNSLGAITIS